MIKLNGISKSKGIAIAVAAIINPALGISGVSSSILQEGLKSIQNFANPVDYPEVIIVCNEWVAGVSQGIPGINTIGIAAQSDKDISEAATSIPCVIGLAGLFEKIEKDTIIIVDGDNGELIIDPDTTTIIEYQKMQEQLKPINKFALKDDYLPTSTKSGNDIFIFAAADCESDIDTSLETLPQGLVLTCTDNKLREYALKRSAGSKIWMMVDRIDRELIELLFNYSAPKQIKLVVEWEYFIQALLDLTSLVEEICLLKEDEILTPSLAVNCTLDNLDTIVNDNAVSVFVDGQNLNLDKDVIKGLVDSRQEGMEVMVNIQKTSQMQSLYKIGVRIFALNPQLIVKAKEKAESLS